MSRRAHRRQPSQIRRLQEARRRLIKRISLVAGFVLITSVIVAVGIFYAGSQNSSGQASSSSVLEVGSNVGNQVPEFDLRLVDGTTVNSANLVSTKKPAFYFFFATW